jgi:hypothetical protein
MNPTTFRGTLKTDDGSLMVPSSHWLLFLTAIIIGPIVPISGQANPPVSSPGRPVTENEGPRIEFVSPVFDFGSVKHGQNVRHDFVFKNIGTAVLEITDVHPGCGCTTAGNWDRRVEPGRTGVIPLQFSSQGFSGPVIKTASVSSNDRRQPSITLQIKGEVWTPFSVTPTMALFSVSDETDASETKVVRIVNQSDQPVTLSSVEGTNSTFKAELHTVKPGKEFELRITAGPPFVSSSVSTPLNIKTSSSEAPTLSVVAQLIVQQPIMAAPDRITLPPGPLPRAMNIAFTVRNSGKNPLVLSDANINIAGVTVNVQELQAGKLFQVVAGFPAGFDLTSDQAVEISLKSNHPKYPVVKVPVVGTPRPSVPPKVSG